MSEKRKYQRNYVNKHVLMFSYKKNIVLPPLHHDGKVLFLRVSG